MWSRRRRQIIQWGDLRDRPFTDWEFLAFQVSQLYLHLAKSWPKLELPDARCAWPDCFRPFLNLLKSAQNQRVRRISKLGKNCQFEINKGYFHSEQHSRYKLEWNLPQNRINPYPNALEIQGKSTTNKICDFAGPLRGNLNCNINRCERQLHRACSDKSCRRPICLNLISCSCSGKVFNRIRLHRRSVEEHLVCQ